MCKSAEHFSLLVLRFRLSLLIFTSVFTRYHYAHFQKKATFCLKYVFCKNCEWFYLHFYHDLNTEIKLKRSQVGYRITHEHSTNYLTFHLPLITYFVYLLCHVHVYTCLYCNKCINSYLKHTSNLINVITCK